MRFKKIKEILINRAKKQIKKLTELYDKAEVPSLIVYACKKYPNHTTLIWILFQLKELACTLIFLLALYYVSRVCYPCIVCEAVENYIGVKKVLIDYTTGNLTLIR